ncbi:HutD family protein [Variovorax dokdonensis]|uniref:HutD family protein n=1 Tax=Variovorax dokdonensis TaxID=344883 RepID=A0ABT7NFG8_9BURK|nr:HutD family protein [Variovorax dokdonensis]MDM0046673.1 HutD family protein [Variovorax dokdonensis]
MPLIRFRVADLPAMPWKNGGGSTREIACWPPGRGLNDFGWRASIATIAAPGPFSVFEGVDRVITLLDGDGVRLVDATGAIDHRLDTPGAPFGFSGDVGIDCEMLGAASQDFNIMVRRGLWVAQVDRMTDAAPVPAMPHGVLLALRGDWSVEGHAPLMQGDGLWWADEDLSGRLEPQAADESTPAPLLLAASIRHCGTEAR